MLSWFREGASVFAPYPRPHAGRNEISAAIRDFRAFALVSANRCPEAVVAWLDLVLSHAGQIELDGIDGA